MIWTLVLAFWSLLARVSRQSVKDGKNSFLMENSTEYLPTNEIFNGNIPNQMELFVSHPAPEDVNLRMVKFHAYTEFDDVEFRNHTFVQSFGLTVGAYAKRMLQIVVMQNGLNLYLLANKTTPLVQSSFQLELIYTWSTLSLFQNETITTVSDVSNNVHQHDAYTFLVETKDSSTEKLFLYYLSLNCELDTIIQSQAVLCNLTKVNSIETDPLTFTNSRLMSMTNCSSTLQYAMTDEPNELLYFFRYCSTSTLSYEDRADLYNCVEMYQLNQAERKITLYRKVTSIDRTEFPLQASNVVPFQNYVMLFCNTITYALDLQYFATGEPAHLYYYPVVQVRCLSSLSNTLACYFTSWTLNDEEFYLKPYFKEFLMTSDRYLYQTSTSQISKTGGYSICGLFPNFIGFLYETAGSDLKQLVFYQTGTNNLVYMDTDFSNDYDTLFNLGANYQMFENMDIGLRVTSISDGFSIKLFTIQFPFFQLSTSSLPKKATCFQYFKNCQAINLTLTYSYGVMDFHVLNMTYFLVNQNFTGLLPRLPNETLKFPLARNNIQLNASDLFYGLAKNWSIIQDDYVPQNATVGVIATENYQEWSNMKINLTNFPFDRIRQNLNDRLTVSVYEDGSVSLLLIDNSCYFIVSEMWLCRVIMYTTPAIIEPEDGVIFQLSFNSLISSSFTFFADSNLAANNPTFTVLETVNFPGKYFVVAYNFCPYGDSLLCAYSSYDYRLLIKSYPIESIVRTQPKFQVDRKEGVDTSLTIISAEILQIFELSYTSMFDGFLLAKFKPLIAVDLLAPSTWSWPFKTPIKIMDAFFARSSVLYIYVEDVLFLRQLYVYSCQTVSLGGRSEPHCFFYTWIAMEGGTRYHVSIDNETYDFWRWDEHTGDIEVYSLKDLLYEYEKYIFRKLTPRLVVNIQSFFADTPVRLHASLSNLIIGANCGLLPARVFLIKQHVHKLLVFNMRGQGMISALHDYDHTTNVAFRSPVPTRNAYPFNYPLYMYSKRDTGSVVVILVVPWLGLTIPTSSKYLVTTDGFYETEQLTLTLAGTGGYQFTQQFRGVAKYTFNITILATPSRQRHLLLNDSVLGFVQDYAVSCADPEATSYDVTRHGEISIHCSKRHYTLSSYLTKDFEMFPSLEGYRSNVELVPPVKDYFFYADIPSLMFTLSDRIYIFKVGNATRLIYRIDLLQKNQRVDISLCTAIYPVSIVSSTLFVAVNCPVGIGNTAQTSLFRFSLNMQQVNATSFGDQSSLPQQINVPCRRNLLKTAGLYGPAADVKFVYDLLFVMDTVSLNSHQTDRSLTVYKVQNYWDPSEADLIPMQIWASLSEESLLNLELSQYGLLFKYYSSSSSVLLSILSISATRQARIWFVHFSNTPATCNIGALEGSDFAIQATESTAFTFFADYPHLYFFVQNDDLIVEYYTPDYQHFYPGGTYEYSSICDSGCLKSLSKYDDYFFLLCSNTTSVGQSVDALFLYDTRTNVFNGTVNPIQMLTLPDILEVPNVLLTAMPTSSGQYKVILSNQKSFLTQYDLKQNASVEWCFGLFNRISTSTISLFSRNIITQTEKDFAFDNNWINVLQYETSWLIRQRGLLIVAALYLCSIFSFLVIIYKKKNVLSQQNENDQAFEAVYNRFMEIPKFTTIERDLMDMRSSVVSRIDRPNDDESENLAL